MDNSSTATAQGYSSEQASRGRRDHHRYPAYFNITLTDLAERDPPITAFITNVSPSGVCVVLPVALSTGQAVRMRIAQTVVCGEVVYSNAEGDYFRTGIRVLPPVSGTGVSELLREMWIELLPTVPVIPERKSKIVVRTVSRRHLRYPVSGTLRVLWRDGDRGERTFNAKIRNASVMGASLRLDEMIPVQSNVSCHDESLRLSGTASVRYCRLVEGKYDIGLEFDGSRLS
jgi:hypothetical protein